MLFKVTRGDKTIYIETETAQRAVDIWLATLEGGYDTSIDIPDSVERLGGRVIRESDVDMATVDFFFGAPQGTSVFGSPAGGK